MGVSDMLGSSVDMIFSSEMQAIAVLLFMVPFLLLYYQKFLHWQKSPYTEFTTSPLASPDFPIIIVTVLVSLFVIVSPVFGLVVGWRVMVVVDVALLLSACFFFVYWTLYTIYQYGDHGASYMRNTVSTSASVDIPVCIITDTPQMDLSAPPSSSPVDLEMDLVEISLDPSFQS